MLQTHIANSDIIDGVFYLQREEGAVKSSKALLRAQFFAKGKACLNTEQMILSYMMPKQPILPK